MNRGISQGIEKNRTVSCIWNLLVLFISPAAITVASLFLAIGMFDIELFFDFFRNPMLFFLNYLPVLILQLLLYALFNRQWSAYLITALLILSASAGDFYKLKLRYEPFSFADVSMIKAGLSIASEYDLSVNFRIIFAIAILLFGTLFIALLARRRISRKIRLSLILVCAFSVFPLWHFVYSSDELYYGPKTSSYHIVPNWVQQQYASKGFVYPFIYSIKSISDSVPEGYDESAVIAVLSEYEDDSTAESIPDILMFQLEAFSNLGTLGVDDISDEAYSIWNSLKSESFHGRLIANVYAGGTIDTEHCVLTGETAYRNVTREENSFVRYLSSLGFSTTGGHPNGATFYNRSNQNSYLGFDEYHFRDDVYEQLVAGLQPSDWFSDCVFFPEVLREYEAKSAEGERVFSFNVTMQGHSPYETEEFLFEKKLWSGSDYSLEAQAVLNNYLNSVADTQQCLSGMIDELRIADRPVVVVLYGDHKPWLGDGGSVSSELGIDMNPATDTGFFNYYSTEYIIWANEAAKTLTGRDFCGEGPDISACYLIPLLFEQMNVNGSAYIQYLNDLRNNIPIINSNGYYFENGAFSTQLSPAGESLFRQMKSASYYFSNQR